MVVGLQQEWCWKKGCDRSWAISQRARGREKASKRKKPCERAPSPAFQNHTEVTSITSVHLSSFSTLKRKPLTLTLFTRLLSHRWVKARCHRVECPSPRTVPCPAKVWYRVNQHTGHFVFVPEQRKGTCQQPCEPQLFHVCKNTSLLSANFSWASQLSAATGDEQTSWLIRSCTVHWRGNTTHTYRYLCDNPHKRSLLIG